MMGGYFRETRILYDRTDQKTSLVTAIVSTALLLVFGIMIWLGAEEFPTEIMAFFVIGVVFVLPILTVVSWMRYLKNICYLKRLCAHGYEVPVCKRDYKGLEELPRNEESAQVRVGNSWESIALAAICWGIAVGCMAGSIPLLLNYQMYGGLVFHGAAALFWVVLGIVYFRQRSREKYRDDVEPEIYGPDGKVKMRKMRTQFADGLVTIAVLLCYTILFLTIIYNLGGVIFRARLAGLNDY